VVKSNRAYGDGSVRPYGNSWRGVVELPPDPVTGKRKRRYVVRRTKSAAEQAVRELRAERDGGTPARARHQTSGQTVGQWLDSWLTAGAGGVKPKTLRRYAGLVEYQIKPTLGARLLASLRAEHVRTALATMAAMPARSTAGRPMPGTTLSDSSIRQAHRVILKAVGDAVYDGVLDRDYVRRRVKAPIVRARKPGRAFSVDDARAVLAAAKEAEIPARWLLALTTGLRQAEVLGLSWPAIEWDTHRINIEAQLHYDPAEHGCSAKERCPWWSRPCPPSEPCSGDPARGCSHDWHRARRRRCPPPKAHACPPHGPCRYTARLCPHARGGPRLVSYTKSDHDRIILMTPSTEAALRALRSRQVAAREAAGDTWEKRPEFAHLVFTGTLGQPVNPREDHRRWKHLLAMAGVPEARLHDARHTTATILTALGIDATAVQTLLGHSSLLVTQGYQHVSAEMLAPAMTALHEVLKTTSDEPDGVRRDLARPARRPQ
jgi:integrase